MISTPKRSRPMNINLSASQIDFLRAVATAARDLEALQAWWKTHYAAVCRSAPIWLLLRFLHGGKLAAQVTLEESQKAAPSAPTAMTQAEWEGCNDPASLLEQLRNPAHARPFGCSLLAPAAGGCAGSRTN